MDQRTNREPRGLDPDALVADRALDCLGSETRSALDGDLEDIEELEESRGGHNEQRRVHDVVDTFIVEPRYLAEQKGTGDVAKERNAGAADRRPARARVLRADQSLLVE